ncbi:hypothetical protein ACQPU1_01980 [Clostridium paraputrificum]
MHISENFGIIEANELSNFEDRSIYSDEKEIIDLEKLLGWDED